jgi:ADP-ribose pyrophosphatase YjhB (NUDIX family)
VRSSLEAGSLSLEILLGGYEDKTELSLPQGFVLPGEEPADAVGRVLAAETGSDPVESSPELIHEGFTYDARQTDHAWVDGQAFLLLLDASSGPGAFEPVGEFDEVGWWPLNAATVNRVPSRHAPFIRDAVQSLAGAGDIDPEAAETLLAETG